MPQLVLLKPHTHAGKPSAVGDRIEVDASTAEWLLAHAIAEIAEIAASDQTPQKVPSGGKAPEVFQPQQPQQPQQPHQSNQRKESKP